MSKSRTLKFSIFLPVRNGGQYFQKCVLSILTQTYRDFDLTILDNASSDGSVVWINELVDSRIHVYRSEEYLSIEDNWARIVSLPKNEFMTIVGHDDLFESDYLETMYELINTYPDASLYQSHFRLIDADGEKVRSCLPIPTIERASTFLASRLSFKQDSFGTGYMFRSADYEMLGGIPKYKKLMFADDALWVQLMLRSYKVTSSKECFSYRVHSQSTSHSPDWESTFNALDSYLDLLKFIGEGEPEIAMVLKDKLKSYMVFWYQWAYFSSRRDGVPNNLVNEITMSTLRIIEMLEKLGVKNAGEFESDVNKYVFGYMAQCYWLFYRLRRWSSKIQIINLLTNNLLTKRHM